MNTINRSQICPICQADNQCAMASGKGISNCWCLKQPQSISAVLARYKAEHPQVQFQHNQCICPQCAKALIDMVSVNPAVEIYIP